MVDLDIDQDLIWELCKSFMQTALMTHKGRVASIKGELVIPEFMLVSLVSYLPKFLRSAVSAVLGLRKQVNLAKLMRLKVHSGDPTPLL